MNTSVSPEGAAAFEAEWNGTKGMPGTNVTWWRLVNGTANATASLDAALVWPPTAFDCSDAENCIGVHTNGDCVCYTPTNTDGAAAWMLD